jgi:Alpha-2-macroglobulin family
VNEKHGLGFGGASSDLKVSEPITISTTLPYAVKRGEVMNVVLKVFNSYPTAQNAKVILWGYKNFEFVKTKTPVLEHDSEYTWLLFLFFTRMNGIFTGLLGPF